MIAAVAGAATESQGSQPPPPIRESLRSIRGRGFPGFGTVLLLIIAQLVLQLALPDDEPTRFLIIVLQAAILFVALLAARAPKRVLVATGIVLSLIVAATAILLLNEAWDIGAATADAITLGILVIAPIVIVYGAVAGLREHRRITSNTILAVLCIYLLIGSAFSFAFGITAALEDASFFAGGESESTSNFLYFSFVTMTTVGYGDLTAATGVGRSFAVAEALTGQIYLVTVVAIIVSNLAFGQRDRTGS